jgi:WD40 repeat protein/tetratricopeptide (TPR) repeat protein/tRNA A-37 threonylcarbamoyl transferase component Bud32
MTLDERLVDLLVKAEEWQQEGRHFTVAELCPDQPELWGLLEEMLRGMRQLAGVMRGPGLNRSPTEPVTLTPAPPPSAVPGYELLGQIGRGGMAVVYKARHVQLNRVVALKMLLPHDADDAPQLKRFRAEARTVARLRHPNIVQIYEVGEHDGRPFFSLEYLEGGTLGESLKGRPQPPRGAAAVVERLARAVQYAHEQGVIHRDIKPANVLLAPDGTPKLSDFGLARETRVDQRVTQSGLVIGTPSYMAPEQAQGSSQEVGPAADVHALGVLLYEMLTGRPPFRGATLLDTLVQAMHQEAASLSRVRPGLPRDLSTICHHCLEKDPARRYPSAGALADDLRRFLDGEPIRARRVGELERLAKWARRRPAIAGLLAALLVALLAGAGASAFFAVRAGIARDKAELREKDAVNATRAAVSAGKEAGEARNEAQRQAAGLYLDRGLALADGGEPDKGLHWMLHALRVAPEGEADFRRAVRANLAAWDGQVHALTQVLSHPGPVRSVAFSPDGRQVLSGCEDGRARLWDAATGERIWESDALGGPVFAVALSPDGLRFAAAACQGTPTGQAIIRLWDRATYHPTGRPIKLRSYVRALAWSPDGKTLATGGGGGPDRGGTCLWDAATGEPRGAPRPISYECRAVGWSPGGQVLAAGDGAESKPGPASVRCWGSAGAPAGPALAHPLGVTALAFSPDGRQLVTGCDDSAVRLWEVGTGKLLREPSHYPDRVFAVAFTPDGLQYVTGCDDSLVRFWDTATGREQGAPVRHTDRIRGLAVSADGRLLATASFDRTVRLWELSRQPPAPADPTDPAAVRRHRDPPAAAGSPRRFPLAEFSLDCTAVLMGGSGGNWARVMAVDPARPLGHPVRTATGVHPIAFGPTGLFATGTHEDPQTRLWSAATGEPVSLPLRHASAVECLTFSPDGKTLATGDYGAQVRLLDATTGREVAPPLPQVDIVLRLAFSPDGKTLAAGTSDGRSHAPQVRLWDVATRRPVGKPMPHGSRVTLLAFRPDGRVLVTGTWDRSIRLWDAATGEPLGPPAPLGGELTAAAFSPDGRLLAAAGRDGNARLWDGQTGAPIAGGSLTHPAGLTALAFSPDGHTLATGSQDGGARLWDVATRLPVGPRLMSHGPVLAVAFAPDSAALLTVAGDGIPRAWPVPRPPAEDDLERLRLRLEVRTGRELAAALTTEELPPEQWYQRRQKLAEPGGPADSAHPAVPSDRAWHEARALDAESRNDGFAALWHLERLPADDWPAQARRARAHALAGRLDLADADHSRAAMQAPAGALRDWYWQAALDCASAERWPAALWCLDRAIDQGPADAALYLERAEAHGKLGHAAEEEADLGRASDRSADPGFMLDLAERYTRRGRWQKAADCFLRARQLGWFPVGSAAAQALVQLRAGDRAAYREACGWLLQAKPAGSRTPATAGTIAWVCALGPDGVTDYAPLLRLAEAVLAKAEAQARPGALLILGAALYRAGRYQEALARLEEHLTANSSPPQPQTWAFLAMAHQRLGHADQARRCLDKIPATVPADGQPFWTALEVDLLRREAEALVRGICP